MGNVRDMPGCRGCPFYEGGDKPFVPDELVGGASLLVYGQNPGAEEAREGKPFVGPTGQLMERSFFSLAGVARGEVSLGNAIRCRVQNSNALPGLDSRVLQTAVEHCTHAHHQLPEGTKAILAMGDVAIFALTGNIKPFNDREGQPSGWRGFVLPYRPQPSSFPLPVSVWTPGPREIPVLATHHVALVFRQPAMQVHMKRDWSKAPALCARSWPVRFPPLRTDPVETWPRLSAFDTEFQRENGRLVRYSLATPEGGGWVIEAADAGRAVVIPGSVIVMHNAPADLASLGAMVDLANLQIEDTMYADAVLWSAFPHDLNTLGSLYGQTNRHKHLEHVNPTQYSGGDALHTMDVWLALKAQLARDLQSQWVYERCQKPLIPIIMRAKQHGSRVDKARAQIAAQSLHEEQARVMEQAQAAVGWPINVGSAQQVARWLFTVEGLR